MRWAERQEGESVKAFRAFTTYRDLGPERTLQKAAEMMGKSEGYVGQLERWSSRFHWVDRAEAYEDWREMLKREALAQHLKAEAEDMAAREARITREVQVVRELAIKQARMMMEYPLLEQRGVRDEDGNLVELHFHPDRRWTKATAVTLTQLAAQLKPVEDPREQILDLEEEQTLEDLQARMSHEELDAYVRLTRKAAGLPEEYYLDRPISGPDDIRFRRGSE